VLDQEDWQVYLFTAVPPLDWEPFSFWEGSSCPNSPPHFPRSPPNDFWKLSQLSQLCKLSPDLGKCRNATHSAAKDIERAWPILLGWRPPLSRKLATTWDWTASCSSWYSRWDTALPIKWDNCCKRIIFGISRSWCCHLLMQFFPLMPKIVLEIILANSTFSVFCQRRLEMVVFYVPNLLIL